MSNGQKSFKRLGLFVCLKLAKQISKTNILCLHQLLFSENFKKALENFSFIAAILIRVIESI